MNVLVAVASRHGRTIGIAQTIAEELRLNGLYADVAGVESVKTVVGYDAIVLGSAVYMGAWMGSALQFVNHHLMAMRDRPLWLFSSGPLGRENPQPADENLKIDEILESVQPARTIFLSASSSQPR